MPIYEYKCENCNEEFEALVFRSDETPSCPSCKGEDIKRMMSACGFKTGGATADTGSSSTPSSGSSSCAGCTSTNCSSCH